MQRFSNGIRLIPYFFLQNSGSKTVYLKVKTNFIFNFYSCSLLFSSENDDIIFRYDSFGSSFGISYSVTRVNHFTKIFIFVFLLTRMQWLKYYLSMHRHNDSINSVLFLFAIFNQ